MLALADVAAGVLVVAALIKVADPSPWVTAVRTLGVPLRRRGPWTSLARAVGVGELAVAGAVWFVGSSVAFLTLGAAYGVFTAVSVVAWRRGGASCGCFGVRSAPISGLHAGLNAVAVVAALACAAASPEPLLRRLDDGVGSTLAYVAFVVLGVIAVVVAMTTAAELLDVRRTVSSRTPVTPTRVAPRTPRPTAGSR